MLLGRRNGSRARAGRSGWRWLGGAAVLLLWFSAALAQTEVLQRANALIREGQPRAALQLLVPLAKQESENADYHYLVGIAALDNGNAAVAVRALKRALELRPDLPQAHAELGRAYSRLGDYARARREFELAKRSNPPGEVVASIDRYVAEMALAESARDAKRFTGYVEAGVGYDSNVNFATSRQEISVPFFGGTLIADLAPTSRRLSDTYASLGGGITARHPLQDGVELRASAGAIQKLDRTYSQFNYGIVDLAGGVRISRGEHQLDVTALHDELTVGSARTRDADGVAADWRRLITDNLEFDLFGQALRLTYPQDRLRDADRTLAGAGVLPALAGTRIPNAPSLAAVYVGQERERNEGVPQFGQKFYGARLGLYLPLAGRALLFGVAGYEHRAYGGADPFFGVTREDRQLDASVGALYPLSPQWALLPALTWTDNRSNIDVFEYRRATASVTARYTF